MTETDFPEPNLALLRKVLDKVDTEPETWVQGCWGVRWDSRTSLDLLASGSRTGRIVKETAPQDMECGTAFCVAGHALVMSGWTPLWSEIGIAQFWRSPDGMYDRTGGSAGQFVLGLTDQEADELFDEENERDIVQEVAERIAERAGERL